MSQNYAKLFKAYDLRGSLPLLNADIYYWLGYGFVTQILKTENLSLTVNLTHDCRYSSPEFYKALYYGVMDAGGRPQALGLGSTDFMYASTILTDTAGIQVTASHNPKDDNGAKILKIGSDFLGLDNGLDKVRDFVLSKIDQENCNYKDRPEIIIDEDLRAKTLQLFVNKISEVGNIHDVNTKLKKSGRKLKVVVDCANGMGGFTMDLLTKLYTEIDWVSMYWEMDGNFPNHPADPSNKANMVELQKVVMDNQADLGVAFDGDADRAYFVDQDGNLVDGNYFGAEVASYMLADYYTNASTNFTPSVVYNYPTSRCIPNSILESCGNAIPSKNGPHIYKKNHGTI